MAGSLDRIADTLSRQGRLAEARTAAGQALALRRELLGEEHRLTLESLVLLARIENGLGRAREGEELARRALAEIEQTRPGSWFERAEAESVLGESLLELGRPGDAEPLLAGSVRALAALASDAAPSMRDALERLEKLYRRSGREREAGRLRERLKAAAVPKPAAA